MFKQGQEATSEITGKPELHYPEWKRHTFRYFVTIPVISICLLIVLATVVLVFELQVFTWVTFSENVLCYAVRAKAHSHSRGQIARKTIVGQSNDPSLVGGNYLRSSQQPSNLRDP